MGSSASPLDPDRLTALLEQSGALTYGHFALSSGRHSAAYVQCAKLLEHPERVREVGAALAAALADWRVDTVVSPALGGLVIGYETARALNVPFRFVERSAGKLVLRRGFELAAGERVAVVEDVVTTGLSVRETLSAVETLGARPVAVGAIIDRSREGNPFGVSFLALMRLALDSWLAADCELCARGEPLVKPGSRPGS